MQNRSLDGVHAFLASWISTTKDDLDNLNTAEWLTQFDHDYRVVLANAETNLEGLTNRLGSLVDQLDEGRAPADELMYTYIQSLSVTIDDEEIFLPSFSDRCLKDLARHPVHPGGLSPFRGLYYAWQLGEASYDFALSNHLLHRRSPMHALAVHFRSAGFSKMRKLLAEQLASDFAQQQRSNYAEYAASLEVADAIATTPDALVQQIGKVKRAFNKITSRLKWRWIHLIPYPCRSSTHFYLSGVRFYTNALTSPGSVDWTDADRFAVNSTDSGLMVPAERYGMPLPDSSDFDLTAALLEELPIGSLTLDFSSDASTNADCLSLRYFERWSRLVTARAYSAVTQSLNLLDHCHAPGHGETLDTELAVGYFMDAAAKNPMRTFYFDSGLLAAAATSKAGGPRVQYVTTRRSRASRDPRDPARTMIQDLIERYGDGLDLLMTFEQDWPADKAFLRRWTLTPLGPNLAHRTCCIWSERESSVKKISHGYEGMLWQGLVQRTAEGFRPSVELALFGGAAAFEVAMGQSELALATIPLALGVLGPLYGRVSGQLQADAPVLDSLKYPQRFADLIPSGEDDRLFG
jgi:hypothetical protein